MRLSHRILVCTWLGFACGGRIAVAQAKLTIPKATIAQHLRRAGASGQLRVVNGAHIDTLPVTADSSATIRRGEVLVVSTRQAATLDTVHGAHLDLPNRYVEADASGQRVLSLRVRVSIAGGGLRYDRVAQAFEDTVWVGLEDSALQTEQVSLSKPIDLQVTGDVESVSPSALQIVHTNVPFAPVEIRARPSGDTVRLRIQPTFDPVGIPTPIPVIRPPVTLHISPEDVPAFGLQGATIVVNALDFAGALVTLSSQRGTLEQDTLRLSPQGVGVARIRSGTPGTTSVRAEIGQLASGAATLHFALPWSFAVAGLLGGMIGAFIRSRTRDQGRVRGARTDLLLGLASGFLAATAYTLGLNLTGLELGVRIGDAATFVVAALGAALDLPGLGRVRRALAP